MHFRFSIFDFRLKGRIDGDAAADNRQSAIGDWQFVCIAFVVVASSGCSTPRRAFTPPLDVAALDEAGFLHYLATVPSVTVDEGLRAILLLDSGPTPAATFDERLAELTHRGAVRREWRLEPEQTLDHGTLAYMLTVTCKTPRSICERLAAPTGLGDRRYALKTCIDEGLLDNALPHSPVTGGQLLAALTRAEPRLAAGPNGDP